jgi:Tol biopolymer transport system component
MSVARARPARNRPARSRAAAAHAPRSLVLTTAVALVLAVGLLTWDVSEPWRTATPSAGGEIAVPLSGGISLVDSGTGRVRELVKSGANASVTAVAWSSDRSTLAYTLFHRRPEDRVSSAELFTVPASGGEPTLLVPRPQAGTVADAPAWSPDGQSIFYSFQGVENGAPVARVERAGVTDGARMSLYADAAFPTVSADGRALAFVFDDGNGQALQVGTVDGDTAREIVPASAFRSLMGPRFSPDGTWIAFVAVGPGTGAAARPRPTGLAALFTVPVAEAHGDPWNIWKVRPDGTELQRVTAMQEDEPLLAWSPDGNWLAVHGSGGLWLLDVRNPAAEPRRLSDGTIGGIDW